ncbi:protocadherin beta-16-like [Octopus vulgaris]|uniref:Protocadherin beta-16-like n=1 Tax=Octopus vulgaris TaxID=6645 RepID=A0AA36BHE3_OCTVU|nr:protocadherin beta-16-like [Octopus vulgaris]
MFALLLVFINLQCYLCVDLIYYVEEGEKPNTYIGDIGADSKLLNSISAKEMDLIRFSQVGQGVTDGSHFFRVSEKTGKLYTTQILDAESMCVQKIECSRSVDIAIKKAETFMKILEIKIYVLDLNDHRPQFPKSKVKIEFLEDDKRGRIRKIPSALDKDIGILNSKIDYQLKVSSSDPFSLTVSKRLDETDELWISLKDNLDRETKDMYTMQVIAKDRGVPPKESVLDVEVEVLDVNDNPPVFAQNAYNITAINENYQTSPILVLSASDKDTERNGDITYHFSINTPENLKSHFELNEKTGELFLQRKFISGQKLTHWLYVEAIDGGKPPLSSMAAVLVRVINQLNQPPKIYFNFVSRASGKTAIISEQIRVGSFIAYIKVEDEDVGQNGDIECQMNHDKFQLVELGPKKFKVIIKNKVDRELNDYYDVTIICRDKGKPPLQTKDKFSVIITDVNDEHPKFSKKFYQFWTKENNQANISIGVLSATDADLGAGGQLHFSLSSSNESKTPFQISKDGVISAKEPLDREQQGCYKFEVMACDKGTPSLSSTASINVIITDENDNAPYFTFPPNNPFPLDISYHNSSQNNITILKAKDIDWGQNAFLTYNIISGNNRSLFDINHYSGLLLFARQISVNDSGVHELQISVKDSGTPSLSSLTNLTLTVTINNKQMKSKTSAQKQTVVGLDSSLLVVIILVAVVMSVSFAIPLTWCIIKCNNRNNQHYHRKIHPSDQSAPDPDAHTSAATCRQPNLDGVNSSVLLETTEITQQTCVQELAIPPGGRDGNQFSVNTLAILPPDQTVQLNGSEISCNPEHSMVPYTDENPRVRAMKILHRAFSCPDDQTNNISYLYKLHLSQIRELAICQPSLVRGPSITLHNENQSIVPQSNAESVQYCTQNQRLYRIHSVRQNTQKTCYKKHCNTSTEQNE